MMTGYARPGALLLPLLLLATPALRAQAVPRLPVSDTLALSLDEALARAGSLGEEVRIARAQVEVARSQVASARSAVFPAIDGSLAYTRTYATPYSLSTGPLPDSLKFNPDPSASIVDRVRYLEQHAATAGLGGFGALFGNLPFGRTNQYVASLTGTQTLYSGKVGVALRIANEFAAASRLNFREQLAETDYQVRSAYYRALLAQELRASAEAAVQQAQRFLVDERVRFQAGAGSELDVLRAEVAVENLRPQLVDAENAASIATLDLKRLVNVPLEHPLRLTTPLEAPKAPAAEVVDPRAVASQRPSVLAEERMVNISAQQVAFAKSAFVPTLDLKMNYGRLAYPAQTFGLNGRDWLTDWNAVVTLKMPIFTGFRRGADVTLAKLALEQEQLRFAQLHEQVQLQYQQAVGQRERAAASITARQRTVDQAQRVYDLTLLRHDQGLASQLEVADARLALLQARANRAQAIADYHVSDALVRRALGASSAALSLSR